MMMASTNFTGTVRPHGDGWRAQVTFSVPGGSNYGEGTGDTAEHAVKAAVTAYFAKRVST